MKKQRSWRFLFGFLAVMVPMCLGGLSAGQVSPAVEDEESSGPSIGKSITNPPVTRTELVRRQRLERRRELEPPSEGFFERHMKSYERKGNLSLEESNFWGFHPRVDWIARGSGGALGVRYWKPEAMGTVDVMGSAFYSWRHYQLYDLQIGLIPNRGKRIPSKSFEEEEIDQLGDVDMNKFSRFKLYGSFRYMDRADESFYGSGPDSKKENEFNYRVKETLAEMITGYQFFENVGLTFKIGAVNNALGQGRNNQFPEDGLPELGIPELVSGPDFVRLHSSLLIDFRDEPSLPHEGWMVAFGYDRFNNINTGNRFNFSRLSLDTRGFVPLGSKQRVLALRGVFVSSDPSSGNRVPFFMKPSLGGGESLRGYDSFRFMGDKMMLLQAEYRWEASRRFELAVFGDTGTVADQGSRLSLDKLKSNWGVGFRLKSSRSTIFRVDQAWSNEGTKTQIRFSAVF